MPRKTKPTAPIGGDEPPGNLSSVPVDGDDKTAADVTQAATPAAEESP